MPAAKRAVNGVYCHNRAMRLCKRRITAVWLLWVLDTGGTCKAAVSGCNGLWAVCGVGCCKCVDNL